MDVSVIIVSYNAASYLQECIDSILALTKNQNFEIIVVDNASTDDSVKVAKSFGKPVTVIESKNNGGYAAGVNMGLKKVTGKYVLVLNPDMRFLNDAISKMTGYMEEHKDVGLAGCTFLDSEEKMLPNGGYFPTLTRLLAWAFFVHLGQAYHPKANIYGKEFYPDWVTGGFMFVRKEVVDKVGLMDETFFMYGEEVDFQYRIAKAGWKIAYTPITKVIHHERKSSGGLPKLSILGEFKGLKIIYGKFFPEWKQVLLGSLLDIAAALRVFMWLVRLKPAMAKIYLEALVL